LQLQLSSLENRHWISCSLLSI